MMNLLVIVIIVIALPLDQIFKAIIPHLAVQDSFNLIFVFTIDECQWWRRGRSMAWDWVWESNGEFDNG
jgi:hypothetical protein